MDLASALLYLGGLAALVGTGLGIAAMFQKGSRTTFGILFGILGLFINGMILLGLFALGELMLSFFREF